MNIDPEDIRRYYTSLADEALLAVDETELVDAAQKIYKEELARRQLTRPAEEAVAAVPKSPLPPLPLSRGPRDEEPRDEEAIAVDEAGAPPDWLAEAACACVYNVPRGDQPNTALVDARQALDRALIPTFITVTRTDPPKQSFYTYNLMVPGNLALQAASVLDKEFNNAEVESEWRSHFATMSDEELLGLDTEVVFGALVDRIERVRRAYKEEVAAREQNRASSEHA